MRRTSKADRSRSKCASIRNGAPRWIRIVSKHPSPYRSPRLWIDTRASSSGTKTPSSHAEAVRGHLHAVLREGLRMSAEFVERLPILRLTVRVRHNAAADREVRRLADDHVFRGIFLALEEFPREAFVVRVRSTAWSGSLDRARLDVPTADAEEPFRTRRQEAVVSGFKESPER